MRTGKRTVELRVEPVTIVLVISPLAPHLNVRHRISWVNIQNIWPYLNRRDRGSGRGEKRKYVR
jgi:hypothetical protein